MEKAKLLTMLNGSSKVVGSKQVLKGIADGTVRCVIVAADADAQLKRKIELAAKESGLKLVSFPSKRELAKAVGVEVDTAVAGVTNAEAI